MEFIGGMRANCVCEPIGRKGFSRHTGCVEVKFVCDSPHGAAAACVNLVHKGFWHPTGARGAIRISPSSRHDYALSLGGDGVVEPNLVTVRVAPFVIDAGDTPGQDVSRLVLHEEAFADVNGVGA